MRVVTTLLSVAGLCVFMAAPVHAGSWTTSYASLARTSYLPGEAVNPPFAFAWQYESELPLRGAPLIAVGRAYLVTQQLHVTSLDLVTGEVKWQHLEPRKANEIRCFDAINGNLRWTQLVDGALVHTPQVGQAFLYVSTSKGLLYSFKQCDGGLKWHVQLDPPLSLVAADAGLVVVGSGQKIIALKPADGSLVFSYDAGAPVIEVPVVTNLGVYAAVRDGVIALDRAGAERWRAKSGKPISSALAVTKAGVLVGNMDGAVSLLAAGDGRVKWERVLAGIPSALSGAGDAVYVGSRQGTLVGLRLRDGGKLWSAALQRGPVDGVALADGRLVVTSGNWAGALLPAPQPPMAMAVNRDGEKIQVAWSRGLPNGSPISAYVVYRQRGTSFGQVGVASAKARSFEQEFIPGEVGYSVAAIAANGAMSERSSLVTVSRGTPLIQRLRVNTSPLGGDSSPLTVTFELREAAQVAWSVADAEGQSLTDEARVSLPEGPAELFWDGLDRTGQAAEPGVYRVILAAEAEDEDERLARAFPLDWSLGPVTSGTLAGRITTPTGGGAGSPAPGIGGTAGDGSEGDASGSRGGVRDHGHGEGRDGAGQGKGKGHPHADN